MAIAPNRTYEIHGNLIKETDKALLIEMHEIDGTEVFPPRRSWFPKSQLPEISITVLPDEFSTFLAKQWIMESTGLLDKDGNVKETNA